MVTLEHDNLVFRFPEVCLTHQDNATLDFPTLFSMKL